MDANHVTRLCIVLGYLASFTGCARPSPEAYQKCINSGVSAISQAGEMEEYFGSTQHEIIHYGVNSSQHTWTSRVYFQPRYCVWMTIEVELNSQRDRVLRTVGQVEFGLIEYQQVTGQEASVAREIRFGAEPWAQLITGNTSLAEMFGAAAEPPLNGFPAWVRSATGEWPQPFPRKER